MNGRYPFTSASRPRSATEEWPGSRVDVTYLEQDDYERMLAGREEMANDELAADAAGRTSAVDPNGRAL